MTPDDLEAMKHRIVAITEAICLMQPNRELALAEAMGIVMGVVRVSFPDEPPLDVIHAFLRAAGPYPVPTH